MAYNDLVSSVQLKSIRLAKLNYSRKLPALSEVPPEVAISVNTDAVINEREDRPPFTVVVNFGFAVKGNAVHGQRRTLFAITGSYDILYVFPGLKEVLLAKEDLDTFAKLNGQLNVWPYLRKTVADAIQAMGFPELLIPVRRFNAKS